MSSAHKQALAAGRAQSRAVRAYVEALDADKPRRGRTHTAESIQRRLERIDDELTHAGPMTRLFLIQERLDLRAERGRLADQVDLEELEAAFVEHARRYSESKGITREAWRRAGVPASVLAAAGL